MDQEIIRKSSNAAFRFVVDIGGNAKAAFTECVLPTVEIETEELKEGGENTQTTLLLGRRKSARITLKNGVGNNGLIAWYIETLNEKVERRPVTIKLRNSKNDDVMIWDIKDAIPVKWTGPQLTTDANTIAIQSLELACGQIMIKSG